jgi:hypothetical protein
MTNDLADFITEPVYSDWGTVQSASTSLPLTAFGTINWTIHTTTGVNFLLTVPGFYVPGSNIRLLSPQDYARYHNLSILADQYGGNSKEFWMMLQDGTSKVLAPIASGGKLPIMIAKHTSANNLRQSTCYSSEFTNVLDFQNQNLSSTQKLLLLDHCRLGHLNFSHQQSLYCPKPTTDTTGDQGEHTRTSCLIPKVNSLRTCTPPK